MRTAEKSGLMAGNSAGTVARSAQTGKTYGVIFATTVEIVAMMQRHKNCVQTGAKSGQEDVSFTETTGNCAWTEGIYGLMCETSGVIGGTRDGTSRRSGQ